MNPTPPENLPPESLPPESAGSGETDGHGGAPLVEARLSLLGRSFRLTCAPEARSGIEALNRQLDARLSGLTTLAGGDPFTVLALAALQLQDEANQANDAARTANNALSRAEHRIATLTARIDQWLEGDAIP